MSAPQSPHRSAEAVDNIAKEINVRYGISLPIRGTTWSPSKTKGSHRREDAILSCIRFLFFADNQLLQKVLDDFDNVAEKVSSEWRFKPHADLDVLPRQKPHESVSRPQWRGSSLIQDPATVDHLTTAMACLLDDSVRQVKNSKGRNPADQVTALTKTSNPIASRPSANGLYQLQHCAVPGNRIRRRLFTRDKSTSEPLTRYNTDIPSDDYPCNLDQLLASQTSLQESRNLNTIKCNPVAVVSDQSINSDDYITPPLSPSVLEVFDELRQEQQMLPDSPMNSANSIKRKRSYPKINLSPRQIPGTRLPEESKGQQASEPSPDSFLTYPLVSRDRILQSEVQNMSETQSTEIAVSTESFARLPNPLPTNNTSLNTSFTTSFDASTNPTEYSDKVLDSTQDTIELIIQRSSHENQDLQQADQARKMLLQSQLYSATPFTAFQPNLNVLQAPFHQIYEVCRVSHELNIPLQEFHDVLQVPEYEYDTLWLKMSMIAKHHHLPMPERSHSFAWQKACTRSPEVKYSGTVTFTGLKEGPLFKFRLGPLRYERSYRVARRFGSDRFLILSFPIIRREDLPPVLQVDFKSSKDAIISWLLESIHHFLGREWRVFLVKPSDRAKKVRSSLSVVTNDTCLRVFLFATNGADFHPTHHQGELDPRKSPHREMKVEELVNWFMPLANNKNQPALKLYSRLNLAVSGTIPTVSFEPWQVVRTRNAVASRPHRRDLYLDRFENGSSSFASKGPVMNDGCARIAKAAATAIAFRCGLDDTPAVFQGRIAGAKGLWMVDESNELLPQSKGDFWIEITDSQDKFEGHDCDKYSPEPARLTFEVNDYSKRLTSAYLNFQLLPILLHQGVDPEVFSKLLTDDLQREQEDSMQAMEIPIALRKRVQDNFDTTSERLACKGIVFQGGLPASLSEVIIFFLDHGYLPQECRFLKDCIYKEIERYCLRLENRGSISIGRSTNAFMMADPFNVLEEGEVHMGFSNKFKDRISGWSGTILHDMDLLVARSPALYPSDIQKVRARFHLELKGYLDVIVFSARGRCSLAEKLSGGDYDGDRAFICWDPSIVTPFKNYSNPQDPYNLPTFPEDKELGIKVDTTTVAALLQKPNPVLTFLRHGSTFNFQENLLGWCTSYHEAYCYHRKPISDESAIKLAYLSGRLVDRPKAGISFGIDDWKEFLGKHNYPPKLNKPAYKDRKRARPTDHVIDHLIFKVAKGVRERTLGLFSEKFKDVGTWDLDLARIWKFEMQEAEADPRYKAILEDLVHRFRSMHDKWGTAIGSFDIHEEDVWSTRPKKGDFKSYAHCKENFRQQYLDLEPSTMFSCAQTDRWLRERKNGANGGPNRWDLTKASGLFYHFHWTSFVWRVAGLELGMIKAAARGAETYCTITRSMYESLKVDPSMTKHAVTKYQLAPTTQRFADDVYEDDDIDWDAAQWDAI